MLRRTGPVRTHRLPTSAGCTPGASRCNNKDFLKDVPNVIFIPTTPSKKDQKEDDNTTLSSNTIGSNAPPPYSLLSSKRRRSMKKKKEKKLLRLTTDEDIVEGGGVVGRPNRSFGCLISSAFSMTTASKDGANCTGFWWQRPSKWWNSLGMTDNDHCLPHHDNDAMAVDDGAAAANDGRIRKHDKEATFEFPTKEQQQPVILVSPSASCETPSFAGTPRTVSSKSTTTISCNDTSLMAAPTTPTTGYAVASEKLVRPSSIVSATRGSRMTFANKMTTIICFSMMLLMTTFLGHVVVEAGPNYGVYFDRDGPYPNGDDSPVSNSKRTDAKRPSKWNRVEKEMYPYDWSGLFDHLKSTNEESYKRHNRNMCEDRALSKCEGPDGDPSKCNYDLDGWHKQSPIQVQYDPRLNEQCDDRHPLQTPVDGTCEEDDLTFEVTPTGLRADLKSCKERPILDYSRNDFDWLMRAIEIKVPGEHEHKLSNGKVLKYDAELQLIHTGTGEHDDDFGIVAIWLDGSSNVKNAELEKYLIKWEEVLEEKYQLCDVTYDEDTCDIVDGYKYVPPKNIATEWERMVYNTFESGTIQNWLDDGTNHSGVASTSSSHKTKSGSRFFRLRISSYMELKAPYDVRKFKELKLSFWVYGNNVSNGNSFAVLYSSDGGVSYERVDKWTVGEGIEKSKLTKITVRMKSRDYDFTNEVTFKIKVDTGSKDRQFYFDDVDLLGKIDLDDWIDRYGTNRRRRQRRLMEEEIFEGGLRVEHNLAATTSAWTSWFSNNVSETGMLRGRMDDSDMEEKELESSFAPRKLSGTFSCNGDDFYCPYRLFRETNNPYYHRYYGSLTSPPCTEQVSWRVMIDPLVISKGQLHRLEMLVAKYMEYPRCKPKTWGKPREDGTCKVDVNRPIQYLTGYHQVEDCEETNESFQNGDKWVFEAIPTGREGTLDISLTSSTSGSSSTTSTENMEVTTATSKNTTSTGTNDQSETDGAN